MKAANTFFAFAVSVLATALPFTMTTVLTACGNDNTAGSDEQQNSVIAKADSLALDSAITEWLAIDTLVATVVPGDPCLDCSHDIGHTVPNETQVPKLQAENGYLYHVNSESFESIVCENDSNYFVYSVNANDTTIQKNLTLPDSVSAEAFESDCRAEGGKFIKTDSTKVFVGQSNFTCDLKPEESPTTEEKRYADSTWTEYARLIIGICRN